MFTPLALKIGPLPEVLGSGKFTPFSRMHVANFVNACLSAGVVTADLTADGLARPPRSGPPACGPLAPVVVVPVAPVVVVASGRSCGGCVGARGRGLRRAAAAGEQGRSQHNEHHQTNSHPHQHFLSPQTQTIPYPGVKLTIPSKAQRNFVDRRDAIYRCLWLCGTFGGVRALMRAQRAVRRRRSMRGSSGQSSEERHLGRPFHALAAVIALLAFLAFSGSALASLPPAIESESVSHVSDTTRPWKRRSKPMVSTRATSSKSTRTPAITSLASPAPSRSQTLSNA